MAKTTTADMKTLKSERAKALAIVTTTDEEYRAKWTRINELTRLIAKANGATDPELAAY